MKVTMEARDLQAAVDAARKAIPSKAYLPILQHVALQADEGSDRITAAGCDLAVHVRKKVPAVVREGGAITVPARTLADLVKMLPDGPVILETNDKKCSLSVSNNQTRANLKGLPYREFPAWVPPRDDVTEVFNPAWLKEAIDLVAYAASKEQSRPVLTAVMIKLADDQIEMVAADGFRLSVLIAPFNDRGGAPATALVPADAVRKLAQLLPDDDDVVVTIDKSKALFDAGDFAMESQLVDANFPDYRQIIPEGWTTKATVGRADLWSALKRALVFGRDSANICRFTIVPAGPMGPAHLVVEAHSAMDGDSQTEIDADVEGGALEIAFNGRYLLDTLGAISSELVVVEATTSASPAAFRPVGRDDDHLVVVMPMHLSPPIAVRDAAAVKESGEDGDDDQE